VRRLLVLLATAVPALAFGVPHAGAATNECRGLQVCVPVAGPWVVVPTTRAVPRPTVRFQLSCPEGHVVGGLDAELTDRSIDLSFAARLGSPVNPGISTERSALFSALYTGTGARVASFRPHVGCIPSTGGGGRIPTALRAVFPPGAPTVRRVSTVRVQAGEIRTVVRRCRPRERLVDGWHALAFRSGTPPTAEQVEGLSASRAVRGNRVVASASGGFALAAIRGLVQVGAVCARSR
jgi:hypothetical protein